MPASGTKAHQRIQDMLLFESFQHAEHHQQCTERAPVNAAKQIQRGRRDKQAENRRGCRNSQHRFSFQKLLDFLHTESLLSEEIGGRVRMHLPE